MRRQAGVSAMLPAGARCVAALMMWLTQDLDASALAHIREVVEGAIPVGGRSGGEHARVVPGVWCMGQRGAVRQAGGSRWGTLSPTLALFNCRGAFELRDLN